MSGVITCDKDEQDLKRLYSALDQDGNGYLDEDELKVLCRNCGMPESYAKLCILLVGNGKSQINFELYKKFIAILVLYSSDKPQFLRLVFNALDADDSGTLEIDEVFVFLRALGINCTIAQATQILKVADDNSDMKLNEKEFSDLVEGLEATLK
ncbi:hypothetical protein M9Y10_038164 [Tritrichomonas musculus]|uniref:EF-hand domain-containing protein n=1 Tax=Tritrichomonas musculus TaxID=1915356 RepID=A0ABR2K7M9_9EUKA